MPENFLSQLVQAGALRVADPMQAYTNALKAREIESKLEVGRRESELKTRETESRLEASKIENKLKIQETESKLKSAQLDRESKILAMGSSAFKNVQSKDDYARAHQWATSIGVDPRLLPDPSTIDSDEKAKDTGLRLSSSADALLKANQGEEFTITKFLPDGLRTKEKFTKAKLRQATEAGLIDPKDFESGKMVMGDVEGTYRETPEQKRAGDLAKQKDLAKFTHDLEAKYKDTPEGKLQKQKDLADYNAKLAEEKPEKPQTIEQQEDNTRQFYALKMKSLLDPMGLGVREGKEAEYNELMQDLSDDINSVKARKTPKYLSKPTKKKATPEILAAYMKKAGNNKKKAREMLLKDNYDLNG